jgi:polysaccharide pyruvyl transferase WcaK-like protein
MNEQQDKGLNGRKFMKISILTQALGHNYGGLLQAYALQAYLKSLGCEVETLNRRAPTRKLRIAFKYLIRNLVLYRNLTEFRNKNLKISPVIKSEQKLREYYRKNSFDIVLVGSDQVWRPSYSPSLYNFYLDFLDDIQCSAKRVSYAASFGVDEWEYSPEQTVTCKNLIQKFDAVSVREDSALSLCRNYLDVDAEWVVDPTLLLDAGDYEKLIGEPESKGDPTKVLAYLLDHSQDKGNIVKKVASTLPAESVAIETQMIITQATARNLLLRPYPKVEDWLKGFRSAKFVVTDSFHGCVFSIIFNRPFVAICNFHRGSSRFHSLLKMFELEERLVYRPEQLTNDLVTAPIDWTKVNKIREEKVNEARRFLNKCLEG